MRKRFTFKDCSQWHSWFAWYPKWIYTGDHEGVRVWLETIERKRVYLEWPIDVGWWEYRLPPVCKLVED